MLYKAVELGVDKSLIRYIAGVHDFTYEEVLLVIQNILADTLHVTIEELAEWIKEKVPKATGALQENLLLNLRMSTAKQSLMRIILKTSIEYAKFVNAMSTSQVSHSGEKGYVRGFGQITLNDPDAIGHFFQELFFYAKERTQINLAKAKIKYLGQGNFSTRIRKAIE